MNFCRSLTVALTSNVWARDDLVRETQRYNRELALCKHALKKEFEPVLTVGTLFLSYFHIPRFCLENERSRLLNKLLLPGQRPTLHPNNAYIFQSDRKKGRQL